MAATAIQDDSAIANRLALGLHARMFDPTTDRHNIIGSHYAAFVRTTATGLYNIAFSRGDVRLIIDINPDRWPFLRRQSYTSGVAYVWDNRNNTYVSGGQNLEHSRLLAANGAFGLQAIVLTHADTDQRNPDATRKSVQLALVFSISDQLDLPYTHLAPSFAVLRICLDGTNSADLFLSSETDEPDYLTQVLSTFDAPESPDQRQPRKSIDQATGLVGAFGALLAIDPEVTILEYLQAVANGFNLSPRRSRS